MDDVEESGDEAADAVVEVVPAESEPGQETPQQTPAAAVGGDDEFNITRSQFQLCELVENRRVELDMREEELDTREALLEVAEQRIEDRIARMETLEASLESLLGTLETERERRIGEMVSVYAVLEPENAAAIMNTARPMQMSVQGIRRGPRTGSDGRPLRHPAKRNRASDTASRVSVRDRLIRGYPVLGRQAVFGLCPHIGLPANLAQGPDRGRCLQQPVERKRGKVSLARRETGPACPFASCIDGRPISRQHWQDHQRKTARSDGRAN